MADLKRNIRLLKLLTVLRGSRYRTVAELAVRFEVSERTLFRDLADLGRDWPLESSPEGGAAYRLPPAAVLPPIALAVEETALLRALLDQPLLARDAALAKVGRSLEAKLAAAVAALEETPAGMRLAPVDRSGPAAESALAGLRVAIERGRAVTMVYQSLSGRDQRPRPRALDPWQLIHRGDAWYVVGFCRVHKEPRIFRLDRISALSELAEPARAADEFDLDHFLDGAWEVWTGRGRHEVVLEFDAALAPLVANARHQAGERQKRLPSGAIDYRVTVNALDEIARWILGFGGAVRVVAPPELRRRVLALARAALEANGARLAAESRRTRPTDPLPELTEKLRRRREP